LPPAPLELKLEQFSQKELRKELNMWPQFVVVTLFAELYNGVWRHFALKEIQVALQNFQDGI